MSTTHRRRTFLRGSVARRFVTSALKRPRAYAGSIEELETAIYAALIVGGYPREEIHDWFRRAARTVDPGITSRVAQPVAKTARDLEHACEMLKGTAPTWYLAP